jgi:predicted RNase H-like nuclease
LNDVTLIGVDCATDPRKVGLALGVWDGARVRITQVAAGSRTDQPVEIVARWLPARGPCLLALDAPLGWPEPFGRRLATHRAGDPLPEPDRLFFRRETDRFIAEQTGRRPLDVGAERIAHTALAALRLLAEVAARTGGELPLAWDPRSLRGVSAIEVYPAATMRMCGLPHAGYKEAEKTALRREILDGLSRLALLPGDLSAAESDADVLDAMLCCLAAGDFLAGMAMPPPDLNLARKEGWIWVRERED